jgi:alkylhydroperoxidase family enzyme
MSDTEPLDVNALPLRDGRSRELRRAWTRLAAPGTGWDGSERLAIAAEVRNAQACRFCRRRKAALSPYTPQGSHDHAGVLPEAVVEIVHRLATDAGRLKRSWVEAMCSAGVTEEQYVECVGVVALVTALDSFDRALGRPPRTLPAPRPGAPSRRRPRGAARDLAWVSTVAPERMTHEDPNPFAVHGEKNIHRALSLVPQEVFNFFDLDVELYLKDSEIRDFDTEYRALTHAQIELLAGRVSALNGCYY